MHGELSPSDGDSDRSVMRGWSHAQRCLSISAVADNHRMGDGAGVPADAPVGRVKRYRQLTAPEVLAAPMSAELLMLEFCGTFEGLHSEFDRIAGWLNEQIPVREVCC